MIKHLCEQRSEQWHLLKVGVIGSTRAKTMFMGKSTQEYKNLVLEIAGELISGLPDDGNDFSSEWMERGVELEPDARRFYEMTFETEIEQVGFITPEKDHKFFEWIGTSPDGLTSDNGMIEIKCPKRTTHLRYIKSAKLPTEYFEQVYWHLYVTGLDYCDFISYYPGLKPFIIRVLPDKTVFEAFEKELECLITEVRAYLNSYKEYDYL